MDKISRQQCASSEANGDGQDDDDGEKPDTLLSILAKDLAAPDLDPATYSAYPLVVECSIVKDPQKSSQVLLLRAIRNASSVLASTSAVTTWSSATVYFMLSQLRHALRLITTSSPSITISTLRGISTQGLSQLLAWSPTRHPPEPPTETVWPAIERRCRQQPLRPAIEAWDGRVTYAELEQRVTLVSDTLLRRLPARPPLRPDIFIGLLLERSLASIITLLAVIRAGCAFVLLDATQPAPRLRYMCAATGAVAVIASSGPNTDVAASLDLGADVIILSTDDISTSTSTQPQPPPPHQTAARPGTALYAGFTSGSTGSPKGFVIRHGAFLAGLDGYCAGLGLERDSRAFLFASCSFVVSITSQLAPLWRGACLCVPSQRRLDHDLGGAVRDLAADWIAITPSAARTLDPLFFFPEGAAAAKRTDAGALPPPPLRTLVMVGEDMTAGDADRWRHLNLYSLYGQSENSKGTMFAKNTAARRTTPSFYPYAWVNAWIVDAEDHDVLLPISAEGELVIESPCLTDGYIDSRHDTDASFVRDPAWGGDVASGRSLRIFKTGDLARRNPADGSFHLLGRKGTMIKIRGQRVEPGEVEHQIRRCLPSAANVAVNLVCPAAVAEDETKAAPPPMLVAFIMLNATSTMANGENGSGSNGQNGNDVPPLPSLPLSPPPLLASPTPTFQKQVSLLSSQLRDVLPSFMIPAAYVELTSWPRTSTGKVHRLRMREAASQLSCRALLAYSIEPPLTTKSHKPSNSNPETEVETILGDLCARVLQLPRAVDISTDDTFVGLGGDSLTARHLITAARARGLSVGLAELLQPVTLADLARRSSSSQAKYEPTTAQHHELEPEPDAVAALATDFLDHLPDSLRRDEVQDVLPTLELQAAYASSRVVDCFPLHISSGAGGPALDAARLERACRALVARHPILRTVFHVFRGRLVQVVLRTLAVSLSARREPSWDAAVAWVAGYGADELTRRRDIGQPIISFVLVSAHNNEDEETHRHILVMRLCHGQYDALCLRPLVHDLWAAYRADGVALAATRTDFQTHVRDCLRWRQPKNAPSYEFWRRVLRGCSRPRPLLPQLTAAEEAAATLLLTTRQLPPITPLAGATAASMVKTAWLEALRRETGLDDVVFGQFLHVWTGRAEGVMGPCMNVVPVRATATTTTTRREAVHALQAQHAAMSAAETDAADALGWSDIAARCTDWPAGTTVDSVVLHQNFDRDIEVVIDDGGGGDDDDDDDGRERLVCRKQMPVLSQWAVFPLLLVTHPRQGRTDALLLMSSAYRGQKDPVKLLDGFARALELLQSDADGAME